MGVTSIQWTDRSVNPIRASLTKVAGNGYEIDDVKVGHYCEMVSPGCAHCYSSRFQPRFGMPQFKSKPNGATPFFDERRLQEVLRRKKPTKWFWCDMTDMFGSWVPDEWINKCFSVMESTPHHTHQVLTKRAERMAEYIGWRWGKREDGPGHRIPARNIWLGVSAEDQQRASERIPWLLKCPAAVRFVSAEPLLGPINFSRLPCDLSRWKCVHNRVAFVGDFYPERFPDASADDMDSPGWQTCCGECGCEETVPLLDWIIAGGESGSGARPCNVEWVRSIIAQCKAAGVACFVKQLGARIYIDPADRLGFTDSTYHKVANSKGGEPDEWPEDLRVREFPRVEVTP